MVSVIRHLIYFPVFWFFFLPCAAVAHGRACLPTDRGNRRFPRADPYAHAVAAAGLVLCPHPQSKGVKSALDSCQVFFTLFRLSCSWCLTLHWPGACHSRTVVHLYNTSNRQLTPIAI